MTANRRAVWMFLFCVAVLATLTLAACSKAGDENAPVPTSNIDAPALFTKHCASCHGSAGQGGSAPAIKPSQLDRNDLFLAIAEGRPGTPMRGYNDTLSEEEVESIIDFLTAK